MIKKWDLSPYHYVPAKGNKIEDKRTNRSWNAIDFLTKVCNQSIAGVFPMLDDLLKAQEKKERESEDYDPPIFHGKPQESFQEPDEILQIEEDDPDDMEDDQDDDYGFRM